MKAFTCFVLAMTPALAPSLAQAENLYAPGNWPALAADRRAEVVGDSLIVMVSENASASNTIGAGSKKTNNIGGSVQLGSKINESAGLNLSGTYEGQGQTSRAGQMIAQLSVVVDRVLPNGDLHVSGAQTMNLSGEHSHIKLEGRVRRADISADNSILSSRLADAVIEYDGKGYASRSAKPGIVGRIFSFLGLM